MQKHLAEALEQFDRIVELALADRALALAALDPAVAVAVSELLRADAASTGVLDQGVQAFATQLLVTEADDTAQVGTLKSNDVIGAFVLQRMLGRGGMGEVWLAERQDAAHHETHFVQQVALKVLKRGMDSDALSARFVQERKILAELNHPHFARFIDGGVSLDGRLYFAMEYVDGVNLMEHANAKNLSVRERVRLLAEICEAVAYAQNHLVVHRDLKPSNILVDVSGAVRVLDFGIAKLLGERAPADTLTQSGVHVLSPAYAAPEQVLGLAISTATDVYALGVILFELVTGALPHSRRLVSYEALIAQIKEEQTPVPSRALRGAANTSAGSLNSARLAREVAGDLDTIILTALQREPARRYATAAALADDLRRWLDARPIAAQPDSRSYRVKKFVARNRMMVGSASTVLLALIAGLAMALWQAGVAREQARLAELERGNAERASARAERAQSFLLSVFFSADETQVRGEKLTAAEILASAVKRLEQEFADAPLQQNELRLALAKIYRNAGSHQTVLTLTAQNLSSLAALADAPKALIAQTHYIRGLSEHALDQRPAAFSDASVASALYRSLGEANTQALAKALMLVSESSADEANVENLAPINEAIGIFARVSGTDSVDYADALVGRATLWEGIGEYAKARADYESGLPVLVQRYSDVHPVTANARLTYAGVLDRLGVRDAAQAQFEIAVSATRTLFGNQSLRLARALFSRGIFYQSNGENALAVADYREALAIREATPVLLAHLHRYLGNTLSMLGKQDQALRALRNAAQRYQDLSGAYDLERWRTLADIGGVLAKQDQPRAGMAQLEQAIDGIGKLIGADRYQLIRPLGALAKIQISLEQRTEASKTVERGLAISLAQLGPTHRFTCGFYLAQAELATGSEANGDSAVMAARRVALVACQRALSALRSPGGDTATLDEELARIAVVLSAP